VRKDKLNGHQLNELASEVLSTNSSLFSEPNGAKPFGYLVSPRFGSTQAKFDASFVAPVPT